MPKWFFKLLQVVGGIAGWAFAYANNQSGNNFVPIAVAGISALATGGFIMIAQYHWRRWRERHH